MRLQKIGYLSPGQTMSPFTEDHKKQLIEAAGGAQVFFAKNIAELKEQTDDLDALMTGPIVRGDDREPWIQFCVSCKSLKWVHCLIAGVDSIMDSDIAKIPNLIITSTKGIQTPPMTDTLFGFIFCFLRRFHDLIRYQDKKQWAPPEVRLKLNETFEKTVGFIGYGNIGSGMAKACKLHGFRVVAAKRTLVEDEYIEKCFTMDQIDEMLPECDFVVCICPLTPETHHLINTKRLKLMKNTAVLINLARGAIIDDDAVIEALKTGEIGGAGLDIFVKEPLTEDNPYWGLENVIISAHTSPGTPYITQRTVAVTAENIRRYQAGEVLLHPADR